MDVAAIRVNLALVGDTVGLNHWDYMVDDPGGLPAMIVEGIRSMRRLNKIVTELEIEIGFYANNAEPKDAARRLDGLLSIGMSPGVSFIDALDAFTEGNPADTGAYWRSCRFVSAGPYRRVSMPDNAVALGCSTVWALTA